METQNNYCVYIYTNKINKKMYVGQTCQGLHERAGNNGYRYMKNNNYFGNAIKKYGFENFEVEVFADKLTKDEANSMEKLLIKKLNTMYPNGYNLTAGGDGTCGYKHTEEAKTKMSECAKNRSEESRLKNSISHRKENLSDDTLKRMSNARKSVWKNMSDEEKAKYSNDRKKENLSKDTLNKMRQSALNRINSDGYIPNRMYGINNPMSKPVYNISTDDMFITIESASNKFNVSCSGISRACTGEQKTSANCKWLFCYDYLCKNGNVILGAISLGYITQERLDEYISSLNTKEND